MKRLLVLLVLMAGCGAPDPVGESQAAQELAPDFTLALGDGSNYSLSGDQKPVYLVFWAEW